jgi:hypothetical protein
MGRGAGTLCPATRFYLAPKGIDPMDNHTKHEIWIMAAASLVPIPLLTAIAVIAVLQ